MLDLIGFIKKSPLGIDVFSKKNLLCFDRVEITQTGEFSLSWPGTEGFELSAKRCHEGGDQLRLGMCLRFRRKGVGHLEQLFLKALLSRAFRPNSGPGGLLLQLLHKA